MINIYKHGTYLRRKLSSQDNFMLILWPLNFIIWIYKTQKKTSFKIETMSFISDIGMCDMPSYSTTYKHRTIRDLEAVLK